MGIELLRALFLLACACIVILGLAVGCADKRPGDMAPDQTRWINKHLP